VIDELTDILLFLDRGSAQSYIFCAAASASVQLEKPTMLPLALRTQPEAKPLQAARLSCGYSRTGRSDLRPSHTMGVDIDSRFENVKGLP
jgi:hypothetical protein